MASRDIQTGREKTRAGNWHRCDRRIQHPFLKSQLGRARLGPLLPSQLTGLQEMRWGGEQSSSQMGPSRGHWQGAGNERRPGRGPAMHRKGPLRSARQPRGHSAGGNCFLPAHPCKKPQAQQGFAGGWPVARCALRGLSKVKAWLFQSLQGTAGPLAEKGGFSRCGEGPGKT